jgi:predicted DNA-binding transcriptional regulator YafY
MTSKNDDKYNQIAFALQIIKLLAEKPRKRAELTYKMGEFVAKYGKEAGDTLQKVTRTISKLKNCGFQIESAPSKPYKLLESSFPVILSQQQKQALHTAAYILSDMGFSAEAGQIARIGNLEDREQLPNLKVNFSPPEDYSAAKIQKVVTQLQSRIDKGCRYSIEYCSSKGNKNNWDIDRSELRLHNGVLYLFAYLPNWNYRNDWVEKNQPLRVDRILRVRSPSESPWIATVFATLPITYRLSGSMSNYRPRRDCEEIVNNDPHSKWVDIQTKEDCLFWFRQRIMQYGSNAKILSPLWLAEEIATEFQKAYQAYCKDQIF